MGRGCGGREWRCCGLWWVGLCLTLFFAGFEGCECADVVDWVFGVVVGKGGVCSIELFSRVFYCDLWRYLNGDDY